MLLEVNKAIQEMTELLQKGKLVVFAGSGVSVPSKLPTWDGLIDEFISICELYNNGLEDGLKFDEIIEDAKQRKNKDPIKTISVLRNKIIECTGKGQTIDYYINKLQRLFMNAQFNDMHKFIVSTDYKYILTTNYDDLFEQAAEDSGYQDLIRRSYTYEQVELISQSLYEETSSIIHIHGNTANINVGKIVLTSDDYHAIKKNNPGFRQIMNDIFINFSVLFVGYGGSDPHLEEVIEEINLALNWGKSANLNLPKYYLILKKDKVDNILSEYKNGNRTNIIAINDHDECNRILDELSKVAPRA